MSALAILHRDERWIAVDKPSGWVVHHGMTRDAIACVDVLRAQLGRDVFPVHRLDRATSGVLLFALSSEAARETQALFQSGEVTKRYWAIVRGRPPDEGFIDHPIPSDEGRPRVPAQTRYRCLATIELDVLDRQQPYSIVHAEPITGRFHQVRRHLKHLGHPLIGDVNYGRGEHNRLWRERFGLHRLALHAESLDLKDLRGELRIEAPLAPELAAAWARALAASYRRTDAMPPGG